MGQVKGIWFVVARGYLQEHYGEAVLDRVANALPDSARGVFTDPLASTWYDEEQLQHALAALRSEVAATPQEMRDVIRGCSQQAVNRFFRAMMKLSSPGFILRQVPTMWRLLRRDDCQIEVTSARDSTLVEYKKFPFFDDENYLILVQASLDALVEPATGRSVQVIIEGRGHDWCSARVMHG